MRRNGGEKFLRHIREARELRSESQGDPCRKSGRSDPEVCEIQPGKPGDCFCRIQNLSECCGHGVEAMLWDGGMSSSHAGLPPRGGQYDFCHLAN